MKNGPNLGNGAAKPKKIGYWTQFELVFLENIYQNFLENNRSRK